MSEVAVSPVSGQVDGTAENGEAPKKKRKRMLPRLNKYETHIRDACLGATTPAEEGVKDLLDGMREQYDRLADSPLHQMAVGEVVAILEKRIRTEAIQKHLDNNVKYLQARLAAAQG